MQARLHHENEVNDCVNRLVLAQHALIKKRPHLCGVELHLIGKDRERHTRSLRERSRHCLAADRLVRRRRELNRLFEQANALAGLCAIRLESRRQLDGGFNRVCTDRHGVVEL
ncbi:MAG: hypothetical protein ABSG64_00975 [Solirubrobacteraceae bacterium]